MIVFCCQFQDENEHGLQGCGLMQRGHQPCLHNHPNPLMENLG